MIQSDAFKKYVFILCYHNGGTCVYRRLLYDVTISHTMFTLFYCDLILSNLLCGLFIPLLDHQSNYVLNTADEMTVICIFNLIQQYLDLILDSI